MLSSQKLVENESHQLLSWMPIKFQEVSLPINHLTHPISFLTPTRLSYCLARPTITLKVSYWGEPQLYYQICTYPIEFFVIKLFSIISDYHTGNWRLVYDGFLQEIYYFLISYYCKSFYFHPLCKVVNDYYNELFLPNCNRERAKPVHTSLSKKT